MGKTQSYIREKMPTWGKGPAKDGKLKLTPDPDNRLQDQILGTIYGNCMGDAIGLLTEFLSKEQAIKYYGGKHLEYSMKEIAAVHYFHQAVFPEADWTDDSDQMILIFQSLIDNHGKANAVDFACKLLEWRNHGFAELGDTCGMGLGQTTSRVLANSDFTTDPHLCASRIWELSKRNAAPNGGVMRTSIVGIHRHDDIEQVISNTKVFCKVTHADPRCVASCVAVTTAISMMLQGLHRKLDGHFDVEALTDAAFGYAKECLLRDKEGNLDPEQVDQLHFHMHASLPELELSDRKKIGYTFKCLGSGFWALRQTKFRDAIEELILEGGDADTNGAVAGALLGCKLGSSNLPPSWRDGLRHKQWLDDIIARYLNMGIMTEDCGTPVDGPEKGILSAEQGEPQVPTSMDSETNNTAAGPQDAAPTSSSEDRTCSGLKEEVSAPDQPRDTVDDGIGQSESVTSKDSSDIHEVPEVRPDQESTGVTSQVEVKDQPDLSVEPDEIGRNSESS